VKLPYDPSILLLDIDPKEEKTGYRRAIDIPSPALFITAEIQKQPKCPSGVRG